MIITIDKSFDIVKDERCYTLREFTGSYEKNGAKRHNIYGYFGDIEGALEKLALIRTDRVADEMSLTEYGERLKIEREYLYRELGTNIEDKSEN